MTGYYRFPTIQGNTIAFVCEDDIWTIPARGGIARRLTAGLGRVTYPALSPDGAWLAFVGREEGQPEVYSMPALGGPVTRLTYLSSAAVLGWTAEGRIVFSSTVMQPFASLPMLYTIAPDDPGAEPQPLAGGPAFAISFGAEGGCVVSRGMSDAFRWKRYRGGTAGDLWLDRSGSGEFAPILTDVDGNKGYPMWLGERICFLSDHEGVGNIYSCSLDGDDVTRHTHHADFYVQHAASDGQQIVYAAGGDLYLLDPANPGRSKNGAKKLKVELHSPRVQLQRKFVSPPTYLTYYALHPKAHSVALVTRGKPFSMLNWDGAVIRYGEAQGVRYKAAEWLNDGQRLVMVSDATGEETLEIYQDGTKGVTDTFIERLDGLDIGQVLALKVSPKDDALVLANHRHELIHVDLEAKAATVLDRSDHRPIVHGLDWSPDGQWVAYSLDTSTFTSAIKLCHISTGETHYVTAPRQFENFSPSFDPGGKYLYFISYRDFDPVYDSFYFELSFPRGGKPYLVTLQNRTPDPFNPATAPDSKDEPPKDAPKKDDGNGEESNGEAAKKEAHLTPIEIDGIQQRIIPFPVSDGRYGQIRGIKDKVLFTSYPIEGSLNRHWSDNEELQPGKGALEVYDLNERKKDFLVSGLSSFDISRDCTHVIYRSGKNMRVLKAGEKPDNGANGFTKKSGWIKLARLRVAVDPAAEWRQMFREAWRMQRNHFWTEDMAEVDWHKVYERYYPLLDRVATRDEFSDLVWDMQGELGTSHAYEIGGDYRSSPRYRLGFLGADLSYDADQNGYRITNIIQGDPWSDKYGSPLARVGVEANVGDVIVAIDGQPLSRVVTPAQLLVNRANDEVQLTLRNGSDESRVVVVTTLREERSLRYRAWVEANRQRVHDETDHRVGYVHIPNMGPFGYSEFHRYYMVESEYEGLIVDVRFNGGGHVSQLLLEKLVRQQIGYRKSRHGSVRPYPMHSVMGPIVALTNEHAGSDGDIFSHAFKLLELGPLIGKRTWGGVIGISPSESLVDGTTTTQPEYSTWFTDVGWQVENYGTDPDIEVDITPQDYAAGRDPQLDRALAEIKRRLEEESPQLPDFGPKPSRALPKLPK